MDEAELRARIDEINAAAREITENYGGELSEGAMRSYVAAAIGVEPDEIKDLRVEGDHVTVQLRPREPVTIEIVKKSL